MGHAFIHHGCPNLCCTNDHLLRCANDLCCSSSAVCPGSPSAIHRGPSSAIRPASAVPRVCPASHGHHDLRSATDGLRNGSSNIRNRSSNIHGGRTPIGAECS